MREIERWMDPKKMDQQWKHRERWIKVAAGGGGGEIDRQVDMQQE